MENSDTRGRDAEELEVSQVTPGPDSDEKSSNPIQDSMESKSQLHKDMVLDPTYPSPEIIMHVAEKLVDGFTKK